MGVAGIASKSRLGGDPKGVWHLVGVAKFASKSRSAEEPKGAWHLVGVAGFASKSRSAGEPKGAWHLAEGCMVALVSLVAVLGKRWVVFGGKGASWRPLEFLSIASATPGLLLIG